MKKETIGLMLGLFLLFGGYFYAQSYYIKQQQTAIEQQNQQQAQLHKEESESAQSTNKALKNTPTPQPIEANSTASSSQNLPLVVANPTDLLVKVPYATFEFTPVGGCLGNNSLVGEKVAYNDPTPVSVVQNYNICKAYGFRIGTTDLRNQPARIVKTPEGLTQITQRANGLEIIRTFHFSDKDYNGEFNIIVKNNSQFQQTTNVDFELGATSDNKNSGGLFSSHSAEFHGAALRLPNGDVNRVLTPFEAEASYKVLLSDVGVVPTWITADSHYWMNTVIPQFHSPINFEVARTGFVLRKDGLSEIDQTVYEAWVKQPVNLMPGQSVNFNYKVYFGPKNETVLKDFDQYSLYQTIDYGFFKIIARPLYHVLFFLHNLIGNWGLAIIVLTFCINILFLPLQIKGYSSAQKMQLIQPQIKALQEKYKDDKQALQRESMSLMSKSGVNPLSGCLPLLPQIPVFFGLDTCLRNTFDLRQSPFFFWIKDLTQADPYFVLPLLMAILMIGYQKMMPMPSMDPTQAKMMKILPILFSVFMIFYPSGLALYVITNTIISMIRQAFLTRHYKKVQAK
ncbi:membrane protein insertase YidC [Fluviispira multicolorata]|uniref:Membrane protein insertase YidC n=1 Tax=Fluviispira multicolorata TaxID=2654512 RepID=A0A833JEP0_9BACT|nr:membrane protein insertase YidC [Fluviispira multicolorata]KAB8033314.1 membrane protein insertase YidC [Fluviispira multicolorata]